MSNFFNQDADNPLFFEDAQKADSFKFDDARRFPEKNWAPPPVPNSNAYLEGLNESQRQGVEATDGPVLVLAGAGSGKTKMLTSRIVHLIRAKHVSPHHILAVTFTNKAAREMRERASRSLGLGDSGLEPPPPYLLRANPFLVPTIGTFHSVCTRLLRKEIDRTPFTGQFVIYDDSDQLSLIKECFGQLGLSDKSFSPKSFQYSINAAKCQAQMPHEIPSSDYNLFAKNLTKVYELYQKELFKNNAIDFGEIITLTYRLLRDNPDILAKYQDLYRYIHVDEYQDTNRAQYLLIKLLADAHKNICVVGDEDQSIYKWRGADIHNILDFEKDYPGATVVKLEQNYRSTQTIINASAHVISNNTARKSKTLWTNNEVGEQILRVQLPDDRSEAELVGSMIKQECASSGYAFSDVALFYRTNAQSRIFEDIFRRERIPYKVIGGLRFYDRKEIKDILAYFRVLTTANDSVGLKRIINVPARSIGKATIEKVEEYGFKMGIPFEQALREAGEDVLSSAARKKVADFSRLIDGLREQMKHQTLSEFYHDLLDRTRYVEELKSENTDESRARIENLQEFDSILVEFENQHKTEVERLVESGDHDLGTDMISQNADVLLPIFLENVTLVGEQNDEELVTGFVSLMTLHTSKGLEYPLVFMVGMEEGLFPSSRATDTDNEDDIEEERRLCYVGMTRAKRRLIMSSAVCRRVYGNIVYHEPSRFFNEIPDKFIEFKNRTASRTSRFADSDDNDFDQSPRPMAVPRSSSVGTSSDPGTASLVGRRVKHSSFGTGKIISVEGSGQDTKVLIEFSGRLVKKFILRYAGLEYL